MPEIETLVAFVIATAVFAYVPGPATIYAATQTVAGGLRAGLMAALGLHVGGYVHVLATAFGLAFLFEQLPALYLAFKYIGAGYLIWLGIKMVMSGRRTNQPGPVFNATPAPTFRESVAVEIFNPKTALFFLAFLPQYADPAAVLPIWAQLLILGTVVNLMFSSADAMAILLADRVTRLLQGGRPNAWPRYLAGGILVALGIYTAANPG